MSDSDEFLNKAEAELANYLVNEKCEWCKDSAGKLKQAISDLRDLKRLAEQAVVKKRALTEASETIKNLSSTKEEGVKKVLGDGSAWPLVDRLLEFRLLRKKK